jgi:hypothetical protein
LARSTGEIQGWLNSDDMLTIDSLHCVAEFFRGRPNVDLAFGHRLFVDIDARPCAIQKYDFRHMFLDMLCYRFYPAQECCFWRRAIQRRAGWIREDLNYSMDFEWFLRLSRLGRAERIDHVLGVFRSYPAQKGRLRDERGENIVQIRDDYLRATGIPLLIWKSVIYAYRAWNKIFGRVPHLPRLPATEV